MTNIEPVFEPVTPNIDVDIIPHIPPIYSTPDEPTFDNADQNNDHTHTHTPNTDYIPDINKNIKRSTRTKHKPGHLFDYICNL